MRWKITIEYDGYNFSGWQRQKNLDTIQARLEHALEKFAGQYINIYAAGRTDAKVHAKGQIAHFDLPENISQKFVTGGCGNIIGAFTHHLNCPAIAVIKAEPTNQEFHARYLATGRHYQYNIINRKAPIAIMRNYAWKISNYLDLKAMQQAAKKFCGEHDFTSFRSSACQAKNPTRTLDRLDIEQIGENITIYAEAPSFLHHQVRNMVGALIACGRKQILPEDIDTLFKAKNRSLAPPTAPPQALCLMKVLY